jgi:hypothetical protein
VEETAKKTKAPAKPRKTAAKKAATPKNVTEIPAPATPVEVSAPVAPVNGSGHSNVIAMKPSHDQVAQLAHKYWSERGCQHGHHVEDWLRAEHELRGKAS